MRVLILAALLAAPAPVMADPAPPAAAPVLTKVAPRPVDPAAIAAAQKMISDPVTIKAMNSVTQAMVGVMMDMKVGELQAAIEGRTPTAAERRETVRDRMRRTNPNIEADIARAAGQTGQTMARASTAMAASLPAMIAAMEQAAAAADKALGQVDKAAANLPDPNYPKR